MGSIYTICCKECKVALDLDKAGWLIFDGIKNASNNEGKFSTVFFCNKDKSKGTFSKEFFDQIDSRKFTSYEVSHLIRAILFVLKHKDHDLFMWQDEGFRVLRISEWRKRKLDFEPFDDEILKYTKEE